MRLVTWTTIGIISFASLRPADAQPVLTRADLGSCMLRSGEVIQNCQIAYRTFGGLSPERDNTILIPTWFTGRSSDWESLLGPTGLVDTLSHFVIVADALANGVSSSPSNTRRESEAAFPEITIRDMVEAHYRLLTHHLQITRLYAVVGVSMGGMQAFEWGVAYPDFAERIVSIVGSPRLSAYDRVLWSTQLSTINTGKRLGVPEDSMYVQLARVGRLVGSTPHGVNGIDPDSIDERINAAAQQMAATIDLADYAAQLKAMVVHDISKDFGHDLASAARAMRARMLIIYSPDDHVVTSTSSADFARLVDADTLSVPSECGHAVLRCEIAAIRSTIQRFLER